MIPMEMIRMRTLLGACGTLLPDSYRPRAGILFPYGHIVGDAPPPHVRSLYRIPSIAKFKADIEFLGRSYQPLRLSDLERIAGTEPRRQRAQYFVLSFDDGMREIYDVIAPILREKGIPAIFFLNSTTVNNKQLMWRHKIGLMIAKSQEKPSRVPWQLTLGSGRPFTARLNALRYSDEHILNELAERLEIDFAEYLRNNEPYLTTEQVLELAHDGFEFGAHSATHPPFSEISVHDQKEQISASVSFIRAHGLPCRYFAFPFDDRGVLNSVFGHMRELDICLSFGTSEACVDSVPFSLQRFALDAENTDFSIPQLLHQLSAKSFLRRVSGTEFIQRN
jgi:peptidoglycan/xylan/chitin deacetylase (PgdA/CDA1 family)